MKSAKELAQVAISVNRDGNALAVLERMFKEHARDQRHACAEAVTEACSADEWDTVESAAGRLHSAVMGAPAPGE